METLENNIRLLHSLIDSIEHIGTTSKDKWRLQFKDVVDDISLDFIVRHLNFTTEEKQLISKLYKVL